MLDVADYTNFQQLGDWVKHGVSEEMVLTAVTQAPLQFEPSRRWARPNHGHPLGTLATEIPLASPQSVVFSKKSSPWNRSRWS